MPEDPISRALFIEVGWEFATLYTYVCEYIYIHTHAHHQYRTYHDLYVKSIIYRCLHFPKDWFGGGGGGEKLLKE